MYQHKKESNMKEWSISRLKHMMRRRSCPPELRKKIENIIAVRKEKNWVFLQSFFSESNKFWTLAKWQLYREGKAKLYGTGVHKRFFIDDTSLIFDKMIEIKDRYDSYKVGKDEVEEWKR